MSVAPTISPAAVQAAGASAAQPAHGATASAGGSTQASATVAEFEQVLAGELSQALVQSSGIGGEAAGEGEGEGGAGGEAGAGDAGAGEATGAGELLSTFVPQVLGESLARGGGLGLTGALGNELGSATAPTATSDAGSPSASADAAASASGGAPA